MPEIAELVPGFQAETALERRLAEDPQLLAGLAWGKPRESHPEGAVGAHVRDLLDEVDASESGERRRLLRLIVLLHDSFKYRVKEWLPKTLGNHHAQRAAAFAKGFTDDRRVLATIEHHDRPYQLWRRMKRTGKLDEDGFEAMMRAIPDPALFLRFVEIDSGTEGKNPEPTRWLREELRRRGYLDG